MAYNNPFMYGGAMKTPQQYQQELNQLQQQYTNQYNQMANQMPSQIPNTYSWKYIENQNEVDNAQIPSNGNPFMFVGNGVFYIKKWQNGQAYIQAYSFAPLNAIEQPKEKEQSNIQESKENADNSLKQTLDKILANQQEFNCRLSALEGKEDKNETQKPTSSNPFVNKK